MTPFLIQILAMGLTITQILSKPIEQFRTQIDPATGVPIATQLLKEGCDIFTKQIAEPSFNPEQLLEGVIKDVMASAKQPAGPQKENPAASNPGDFLKKIDFVGLLNAYRAFCKGDTQIAKSMNLTAVIVYYNNAFKNLKDVNTLKTLKLGEATFVLDAQGKPFNEIYGPQNRRLLIPISKIPNHVKQAFVSAEDQSFYTHKGIDPKGLFRAFGSVAMSSGANRPQGGSTITQQVVKNLLINDDLTIERKMREMVLASRLEKIMSKDQILELYLNYIFLGRSSAGIEMAARSYFGPQASAANLSLEQAAMLAALTKGPTAYSPDFRPAQAKDRRQYVLNRMNEDCQQLKRWPCPSNQEFQAAAAKPVQTVPFESPTAKGGFYFLDSVAKEANNTAKIDLRAQTPYLVQTTVHPGLQKATEAALREGLMEYEQSSGRKVWTGAQGSIKNAVEKYKVKWQEILPRMIPQLYDVPWTLAVVLADKKDVGLSDGKTAKLRGPGSVLGRLKPYDLIFVDVTSKDGMQTATLKIPPRVQGSAIVLENQTGRVLAISGGFSYARSEYNRALLALRQPGSTIKPFVYLAALSVGLQPNTLLPNIPHEPPLFRNWQPKNYDGRLGGLVTFRTAVENSLNLPTIQLASRLGGPDPGVGLSFVQNTFKNVGLYSEGTVKRDFAEVLGSRETRLIDLAAAYATVANSGYKPTPYFIEAIRSGSQVIYTNQKPKPAPVSQIDRVSFYQLRRLLEGTISRGTAKRLQKFEGIIAGKTGTSNNETDAWFVVFTNDITIAVWVGYDDKKIYTNLGAGSTGGRVALPIAEKILKTSFDIYRKSQKLNPPPEDIRAQITEMPIDLRTGSFDGGDFIETFRINPKVRGPLDTTHALLKEGEENLLFEQDAKSEEDSTGLPPVMPTLPEPKIYNIPPPASAPKDPSGLQYEPGVENHYEDDRKSQRKVDPEYEQFQRYYFIQR